MPLWYGAADIQTFRRLVPVIYTLLFLEDFLGAIYKSSWGCCVGAVSGGWWQDEKRNGEVLRFLTTLEGHTNDSIAVGFLAPGTGAAAPPELSSQSAVAWVTRGVKVEPPICIADTGSYEGP